MSASKRLTAGAIGVVLVIVYSAIMMATSGATASWAWLLLVAAIGALVVSARSSDVPASGERNDG